MLTDQREAYRKAFHTAWQKHLAKITLDPVEAQLVEILVDHPEYHSLIEKSDLEQQEFSLEENPFFHMSLHLAIREQIRINRPIGISTIYAQLLLKYQEKPLDVEHRMMTCLANIMWESQQTGEMPSEEVYLAKLAGL